MPIDLTTLSPEVKLEKYAGWDQTAIAADLNARNIVSDVDANCADIVRYMLDRGIDGRMRARIARSNADLHRLVNATPPDAGAISAAEATLARLENIYAVFTRAVDIATSSTQRRNAVFTEIDWLRDSGVLTNGTGADNERNALRAFAVGLITRIEQMFARGDRVTPEQVEAARRLP